MHIAFGDERVFPFQDFGQEERREGVLLDRSLGAPPKFSSSLLERPRAPPNFPSACRKTQAFLSPNFLLLTILPGASMTVFIKGRAHPGALQFLLVDTREYESRRGYLLVTPPLGISLRISNIRDVFRRLT